LKELFRFVVQEVPAAEMDAALGASKGERTDGRLGYRSGYYGRTLITRVGNSNFEFRRTAKGISPLRSLNVISAARRHWSRR
jgi:transposase-like protein